MKIETAIKEYLDYLEGNDSSPKHVHLTQFKLRTFNGWCAESEGISNVQEITALIGNRWKLHWQQARKPASKNGKKPGGEPYSSNYIHGMCRTYRAFVNWLYEMRLVKEPIPFKMPLLRKTPLLRTGPELLKEAVEACETERDRLLLTFVYDTGARREEVTKLLWGHVNLKMGVVMIIGKGEKVRYSKMGKALRVHMRRARIEALERCGDEEILASEPVFVTRLGTGFSVDGLSTLFARLSERMGKHITAHSIRRGSAKEIYLATGDLTRLMEQFGWSSFSMVKRYVGELTGEDMGRLDIHSPLDDLENARKMVGHGAGRVIRGNQRTRKKNQAIAERANGREVLPRSAKGARQM